MDDTKLVMKQIIFSIIGLTIIAFGVGVFFVDNILYWALGIVVGALVSIIKLVMLERTLNKAVDMSPEDAKNYTRARYMMRFMLSIVLVVLAIKIPYINVIGVIVGLLLLQPAVYIVNFINRNNK